MIGQHVFAWAVGEGKRSCDWIDVQLVPPIGPKYLYIVYGNSWARDALLLQQIQEVYAMERGIRGNFKCLDVEEK